MSKYKIIEKEIKHFRELYDHDFKALDKALELKAGQDKIHFESLNHEAARVLAVQTRSVSQEIFDASEKTIDGRFQKLEERIDKNDKWQTLVDGRKPIYTLLQAVGVSLLVILITTIMKPKVEEKVDDNKTKIEQLEQKINSMQSGKGR